MNFKEIQSLIEKVKNNINRVIVGKEDVIDLLLVGLVSSGHVLLEDVPGMGKTLLAKTLSRSIDCSFKRIQFTPDLLPSDLTGINFYNQKVNEFQFREGPIFTNILLADEINRATPRTQSSLLECMEERQVTIDGETRRLTSPFMVVATQNPVEIQGTFPLPEAQLDRFLIRIRFGYPTKEEGIEILKRFKGIQPLDNIEPVISAKDVIEAQISYNKVYVCDDIYKYIMDIAEKTRSHKDVVLGISPRGSQALLKAVQVYAILKGRDYVIPDDIKDMIKPVWCHRIILTSTARARDRYGELVIDDILKNIDVPTEDIYQKGMDK